MKSLTLQYAGRDVMAGVVVYLVALPLCLGVALASGAPLASGIIAGVLGGIVVGLLSGSHTSVAGPAAGLTAVVAVQISQLGSFEAFLVAVVLAGVMQVALGIARAGFISSFFPNSVIKGLLAAIGVILILKQIPHLLGHDQDPEGEMSFQQPDGENSITELLAAFFDIQPGAVLISVLSILILVYWDKVKVLKQSPVPSALVVVLFGVAANAVMQATASPWVVTGSHLVQVPVSASVSDAAGLLAFPDWSILSNSAVYMAALTLAIVATLETLLNLDAVDQLDPEQRRSPPNRELVAQGVGNIVAGLIGGIPVTSVIVRSSVNINAGVKTKLSTVVHGVLLAGSVLLIPALLNTIPLAALAAILLVTGFKLAKPGLFKQMWADGLQQFLPFVFTVVVIVFTDLLVGVMIGLGVATMFILWSNLRRPVQRVVEKHASGDVVRIELANQVSFLNRAALENAMREVPRGGHLLIDARQTDYIDPDIVDLIRDFIAETGPALGVGVSCIGFKGTYEVLNTGINFEGYSTQAVQRSVSPADVLALLKVGNERFLTGTHLTRDLSHQMARTTQGQAPLAVVLSCIDSRAPVEQVFDVGIGDIFTVRIAGNVTSEKVLGSIEYACKVAGAKLIVVMGHTLCGAVTSAVTLKANGQTAAETTGCEHIDTLVGEIQACMHHVPGPATLADPELRAALVDEVAGLNVQRTIDVISTQSAALRALLEDGSIAIAGSMYDVGTGRVHFTA
ncbi:MAG: bifunctional SulP family inorganic anion transporter/carbonic anhydrase [Sandaracinaceae bacterium]|nr:bifunctional SulP family inorganic anion transporter/carbonic anhydrase [Sandaracinaceae bacterium]MBK8409367.1 bifunctional SulP family inorganic anion transporter/carbonic anhydrase [Sandaracinaceae bacterium]MBP7683368.1 bifunctional SulP family inorganic anion transporter/carbonic anhydrase [Deltaproteobacteria bacterium]